ncbi:MAG TPA: ERF family protein, partial [Hyphomicrobiaceae bacterium]
MTGQDVVATIEQPGSTEVAPRQAITPMEMLQIAVEKGATLDQLQKLMDLQERWEANEARKAFVAALSAFKAHPPMVRKNRRAGFESRRTGDKTEYEYATLDHVVAAITPALSANGLSHRWET